jgi:hypothetical protein
MFKLHISKNSIHYKFIIKEYFKNHYYLQEKNKRIK